MLSANQLTRTRTATMDMRAILRIQDPHEQHLRYLEEMTSHQEMAAAAALHYCAEHKLTAPDWAIRRGSALICNLLSHEKLDKRGRASGIVARYRQDLMDIERWDAVEIMRREQKHVRGQVERIQEAPYCPAYLREDREKMLRWLGHDWPRAYECAAMYLRGRRAYASPAAIRRSYLKVQKHFKGNGDATRYCILDESFLRALGFEGSLDRKRGTKLLPLYNLEL
jgi:hypothetical protein